MPATPSGAGLRTGLGRRGRKHPGDPRLSRRAPPGPHGGVAHGAPGPPAPGRAGGDRLPSRLVRPGEGAGAAGHGGPDRLHPRPGAGIGADSQAAVAGGGPRGGSQNRGADPPNPRKRRDHLRRAVGADTGHRGRPDPAPSFSRCPRPGGSAVDVPLRGLALPRGFRPTGGAGAAWRARRPGGSGRGQLLRRQPGGRPAGRARGKPPVHDRSRPGEDQVSPGGPALERLRGPIPLLRAAPCGPARHERRRLRGGQHVPGDRRGPTLNGPVREPPNFRASRAVPGNRRDRPLPGQVQHPSPRGQRGDLLSVRRYRAPGPRPPRGPGAPALRDRRPGEQG